MKLKLIGVPSMLGCPNPGTEYAFATLMTEGLAEKARRQGVAGQALTVDVPRVPRRRTGSLYNPEEVIASCHSLDRIVTGAFEEGLFPFVIGGDHSLAIGSLAACLRRYGPELCVLWIDAHTDINTDKTTVTGNIHGIPLASAMGLCSDPSLRICHEYALKGENIFVLGGRSIDPPEQEICRKEGVHLISPQQIRSDPEGIARQVAEQVGDRPLYISFDTDVLDANHFTATGLPVPNGIGWEESRILLEQFCGMKNTVYFDCVEFCPPADPDRTACRKLLQLLDTVLSTLSGHLEP